MSIPTKQIPPLAHNLQRSVVTPLIRQTVQTLRYAFFYLYPHMFSLEIDENHFIVFKPAPFNWKIVPFLLSTITVTGIIGWGSCVYICLTQILGLEKKSWIQWNLFNTLITLGLGLAATAEMISFVILHLNHQTFLAFTGLLKLERQCIFCIRPEQLLKLDDTRARMQRRDLFANEFRGVQQISIDLQTQTRTRLPVKDTIGALLNVLVVLASVIPAPFVMVGIATNLDPFYFVFEQLFLPHPYYRTMEMIVFVPMIRFFLGFICVIDFLRFGIVIIITTVVAVFGIISISHKLKFVFYEQCLLFYLQLRLIMSSIHSLTCALAGGLIFGGQFATILCLWIVFKCFKFLSIYIIGGVLILGVYLIVLCAMLLPAVGKIRTKTKILIRSKMMLHYSPNHANLRKYYYYNLWKSQQSIYFTCADFFVIQKGVTMTYFRELVTNLVNAVLLIDPKAL